MGLHCDSLQPDLDAGALHPHHWAGVNCVGPWAQPCSPPGPTASLAASLMHGLLRLQLRPLEGQHVI